MAITPSPNDIRTNTHLIKEGKILKIETRISSGSDSGVSSFYYKNLHLKDDVTSCPNIYVLDVPKMSAITSGTFDYGKQNELSILSLYGRAQLKFSFSANSYIFSSSTHADMVHDLYKIPYDYLHKYRENRNSENWNLIKNRIDNPFMSYTASTAYTATISTSADTYIFYPKQIDKQFNRISESVFEDKAIYFFNTRHFFSLPLSSYTNTYTVEDIKFDYNPIMFLEASGDSRLITTGDWSGTTAKGLFFVCLSPPSRPVLLTPYPESQSASTSSPVFSFSNVSGSSYTQIDINYEMSDSGFTISSAITSYKTEKENQTQITVPLLNNADYLYRLGNVKYIDDIFNTRHYMIAYTDVYSATTASGEKVIKGSDNAKVKDKINYRQTSSSEITKNPNISEPES